MIKLFVEGSAVFLINLLNNRAIPLKRVEICGKGMVFCIKGMHLSETEWLLNNYGKRYEILDDTTVRSFFMKNVVRFGLYAGIVFVMLAAVLYSLNVNRVEIQGNGLVSDETILSIIDESYDLPGPKGNIDRTALAKKIIGIDGISSASVEIKGNTLIVRVYEELPDVDILDKTDFRDIVASYDSVITRVVTYSGEAKIKVGDSVRKGTVLISSDISLGEGLNAKEYTNGVIYGRVWFTKTLIYGDTMVTTKRTGQVEQQIYFPLFGEKAAKCSFPRYEMEESVGYIPSVIPLRYVMRTYYETAEVECEVEFLKNKDGIVKDATENFFYELPESCEVLRNWHEVKRVDKSYCLDIYYEVELVISEKLR